MTELAGVDRVGEVVRTELEWIFRDQPIDDFGIDAHVEVVSADQVVTGRLLALQIKAGDSWFSAPKASGWTFRDSNAHLAYWLGHSLRVVVVLVNSKGDAYWQVVDTSTVRETEQGFALHIPRSQPFDRSALEPLTKIAGRNRGLIEALPAFYEQLPSDCVVALRRAEAIDALGAARVADRLVDGSETPDLTTDALVAASPTWIAGSAAAQDLWRAIGAYAAQHERNAPAARALERSAELGGDAGARARAFAGLSLLFVDRSRCRQVLEQARSEGAVALADMGLAVLESPIDHAHAVKVPASIQTMDDPSLDREPTLLNFLGENALRNGDLNEAVKYRERAVAAATTEGSGVHLELARTIWRRAVEYGQRSTHERRRAIDLARRAVEDRRRWRGPSAAALALYLDIELTGGDSVIAVRAALPASEGGLANDVEATDTGVARRGALASLVTRNDRAYDFFLSVLAEGSAARAEILAIRADLDGPSRAAVVERWTAVLELADGDDGLASRCIGRLVRAGVWPSQADDLLSRSILPRYAYDTFRAVQVGYGGQCGIAIAQLRELAEERVTAVPPLVTLLEDEVGANDAIAECERQILRWNDPMLVLQLIDLLRRGGHDARAAEYAEGAVNNERFSSDVRAQLCNWLARFRASAGEHDAAIAIAYAGLDASRDPDLVWVLAATLFDRGRVQAARDAIDEFKPSPSTDGEVRLWTQLHLGVPLSHDDSRLLVDLIDMQPDGDLRDTLRGLLVREVVFLPNPTAGAYPVDVYQRARDIAAATENGPRAGLFAGDDSDEFLREALMHDSLDPREFEGLLEQYRAGTVGLSEIASRLSRPYGSALLQRPANYLYAIDISPLIRQAGERAAERAVMAGATVADLSSVHLLNVLADDDRLRIRSQLRDIAVSRSSVVDAVRTREAIRGLVISTFSARLRFDGSVERSELNPLQRATLREQSELLEKAVSLLSPLGSNRLGDPTADGIEAARTSELTLWCDDAAARQRARALGVATFSLVDLMTVLDRRGVQLDVSGCRQRLIKHYVVDLPFGSEDIIAVASETAWVRGPAHTALTRAQWWALHSDDWEPVWCAILAAAVKTAPLALIDLTIAGLIGACNSVPSGLGTHRFQRLVVLALAAYVHAERKPPVNFLDSVCAGASSGLSPRPQFVLAALIDQLRADGVVDHMLKAVNAMPGVDLPA